MTNPKELIETVREGLSETLIAINQPSGEKALEALDQLEAYVASQQPRPIEEAPKDEVILIFDVNYEQWLTATWVKDFREFMLTGGFTKANSDVFLPLSALPTPEEQPQ